MDKKKIVVVLVTLFALVFESQMSFGQSSHYIRGEEYARMLYYHLDSLSNTTIDYRITLSEVLLHPFGFWRKRTIRNRLFEDNQIKIQNYLNRFFVKDEDGFRIVCKDSHGIEVFFDDYPYPTEVMSVKDTSLSGHPIIIYQVAIGSGVIIDKAFIFKYIDSKWTLSYVIEHT